MQNNMRKLTAVILVLAMVMLLGGCAKEKDALLGTWKTEIDCADMLNEGVASAGDQEMAEYLYIDSFSLSVLMTFNEDDTYSMSMDEIALNAAIEQLKDDYQAGIERYLTDMMAAMGVEMSIDEIMTAMGMSMEELIDTAITEEMVQELVDSFSAEGKFKASDGKLYLSAGLTFEVDETMYERYELEGSKLTLLESVSNEGIDEQIRAMYPMEFNKVS